MPSVIGGLRGGFHYFLFRIREGKRESTLNIELPPSERVVSLRISTFNAVRGESKRNWKRFSRDRGFPNGEQLSVHWPGRYWNFFVIPFPLQGGSTSLRITRSINWNRRLDRDPRSTALRYFTRSGTGAISEFHPVLVYATSAVRWPDALWLWTLTTRIIRTSRRYIVWFRVYGIGKFSVYEGSDVKVEKRQTCVVLLYSNDIWYLYIFPIVCEFLLLHWR